MNNNTLKIKIDVDLTEEEFHALKNTHWIDYIDYYIDTDSSGRYTAILNALVEDDGYIDETSECLSYALTKILEKVHDEHII